MSKKELFRRAFRDTIPVLTGYLTLGTAYGILMQAKGYGWPWVLGSSALIYAGAMQFLTADMLSSAVPLLTAMLTALLVNARHLFYGLSLIDRYKTPGLCKSYMIFGLTDETYSLVCRESDIPEQERECYAFYVTLLDHIYWISGSLLGSLVGSYIQFNTAGIDFSLTALFITIFVDQWRGTRNHMPALIGIGASLLCLFLFGPSSFLIPAMVLILLLLMMMKERCL